MTLSPEDYACASHATEHDLALRDAYREGWKAAYDARAGAYDLGRQAGREEARREQAMAIQKKEDEKKFRTHDERGSQIVQVAGYTYVWRGDEPLKVGDLVELPPGWGVDPWQAPVSALGSSYRGYMKAVIRRLND